MFLTFLASVAFVDQIMTTLQAGKDPPDLGGSDDASNWARYGWTLFNHVTMFNPLPSHCLFWGWGACCSLLVLKAEAREAETNMPGQVCGNALDWREICTVCWMPCRQSMVCRSRRTKSNRETVRQMRRVRKAKEPQEVKVELTSVIVGSWSVSGKGVHSRVDYWYRSVAKPGPGGITHTRIPWQKSHRMVFAQFCSIFNEVFNEVLNVWFKIKHMFCWIVLQLQFVGAQYIAGFLYMFHIFCFFLPPSNANWQKPYYWDGFLAAAYKTLRIAVFIFWMCAKRTVNWGSSIQAALSKPDQQCLYLPCFCPEFVSLDSWIHRFSPCLHVRYSILLYDAVTMIWGLPGGTCSYLFHLLELVVPKFIGSPVHPFLHVFQEILNSCAEVPRAALLLLQIRYVDVQLIQSGHHDQKILLMTHGLQTLLDRRDLDMCCNQYTNVWLIHIHDHGVRVFVFISITCSSFTSQVNVLAIQYLFAFPHLSSLFWSGIEGWSSSQRRRLATTLFRCPLCTAYWSRW